MDTFLNRISDFRKYGRVALLGCTFLVQLSAQPEIPFAEDLFPELQALLDEAMLRSPQLELDSLRIEEREGDLEVAKGQRRLNARLSARLVGSYEAREDIENQFRGAPNASLTLSQPLYRWDTLERRETIARHRVALQELESDSKGTSQFMQVRQGYLQWLLMRERKSILEQSIELSESFVEARRKLVEVGVSSEQDVLDMEARLMENRESLAYVEKAVFDLERSIARLVGPDLDIGRLGNASLSLIEPVSEEAFRELQDYVRGVKSDFVDPVSARLDLLETIEDEQLAILDKQNWPNFDIVAGIYTDNLDAVNEDDYIIRTQYYAGLQISWNIFDGWQKNGLKRSALARKRGYSLMRERSEHENRAQADALLSEISLNLKQIEARGKREALLGRRMELLREQIKQNQVSGVDLMKGEIDYLEVRRRLMEARVNYLMNMMELAVLIGEDPAVTRYRGE